MEFGTAKRLSHDPNAQDSAIQRLNCENGESLSNIIRTLNWGNNKRIRIGGFLIADQICKLRFTKLVKNPFSQFKKGRTYISPKHGRTMAVVIIN